MIDDLTQYAITDQQREIAKGLLIHESNNRTAIALGLNRRTVDKNVFKMKERKLAQIEQDAILKIPSSPHGDLTAEELIQNKIKLFQRKKQLKDFNKLINIAVKDNQPIGICLIGDPHVDDDGCDIMTLQSDLEIISKTVGMYAGHVGDLTNNWVGRLARLYANQTTTASQAITLMEWMLNKAQNLFVIGGNHDCWNQGMDMISFVMRSHQSVVSAHGARIALNFPNGKQVRIHARHHFKGHSMYNPTHGHRRAQLWEGNKDHIYVSGHVHTDAASMIPQADGTCSWAFVVSGYKVIDDYAEEGGFTEQRANPSVTVIINPNAKTEAELVKPYWDTQAAADYLNFLRGQ